MVNRSINVLSNHSFFLFGARGVGKTSLIRELVKNQAHIEIDLLQPNLYDKYLRAPEILIQEGLELESKIKWIFIDEIQKLPRLLDCVHKLIEETSLLFALSGSSAKKLRAGGANLLAGRALIYNLFPFTHRELKSEFSLQHFLSWGSLPRLLNLKTTEEKELYLDSYTGIYLREEVWNEQLIRALEPFRKFLEIAAQTSGTVINFAKIARDVGVDEKTAKSYFTIAEETLLGFFIEAFHASTRKRQKLHPKFYLFDLGVMRSLERTLHVPITLRTYGFGRLFEHFLVQEIYRLNHYQRKKFSLFYLFFDSHEVDLLINRPGMKDVLLEIKSTTEVKLDHLSSLEAALKRFPDAEAYCLSLDQTPRKIDKIRCLPWEQGLVEIGL